MRREQEQIDITYKLAKVVVTALTVMYCMAVVVAMYHQYESLAPKHITREVQITEEPIIYPSNSGEIVITGYRVYPVTEMTQEMIEDAKIGKIKSRAKQFTTSYGRTREKYAAALIAAGIGKTMEIKGHTYDVTCADKTPMFNAKHPSAIPGKKMTQSNLFKAAFSRKVLNKVQELMQKFTDDDGNLLNVMPDTIIIPNDGELKDLIYAAVGSELDPNTNNNAWNFQVGLWNVIVWNYLPATLNGEPYFIVADSKFLQDYMCIPFVDRVDLTVTSYIDENTDANVFKGRARFAAGFNNWRGMAICGAGFTEGTDLTAYAG